MGRIRPFVTVCESQPAILGRTDEPGGGRLVMRLVIFIGGGNADLSRVNGFLAA